MEWGARPNESGPLYAIADGMCVHAQVFPVVGGAIFAYGNGEYINYETSNPTLITTAEGFIALITLLLIRPRVESVSGAAATT